ncbi:PH1570 family protein [Pyrococcus kukulkanii]|uniref:PH1570 family protein n=1 Tax=Pyrococcus kukulkanii TaxID=1609559 RepID=UPI00356255A5
MQCEEKLEVFENGFKDEKFNVEVRVLGGDGRKVLLALIYEMYLPEYGPEYVYPFECAKEFWGIYMDPSEIEGEEVKLKPIKFTTDQVRQKIEGMTKELNVNVDVENAEVYKTKEGYLVVGKNFILDPKGRLFVFNKPSLAKQILKYIWKW